MKCHNCGFDAENNAICPICGETMPAETYSPEPQMNTESNATPYQQPVEPQYNAPTEPAQRYENPYAQQPVAPEYNAQHYENPYAQQPQEPDFQQSAAPQHNAPQQPTPNIQYNYPVSAPPKKSNGTAIVLTSVIASVVVVGVIIAVLSVTLFNKRIYDIPDQDDTSSINYYDDFYDDLYDDYGFEEFKDDSIHKIGESYQFDYAQITLKNVEITKKYDDGKCQYAFTIEVKNTTSTAQIYELWYDLYDSMYSYANLLTDDYTSKDKYMEYIYTEGDYNEYDFELESGKATEFVVYYKGMENNNNKVYPQIGLSDSKYNYNATTYYEVNLGNLSKAKNSK